MAERDAFGALLLSLRDAPGLLPRLQRLGGSLSVLKRLSPRQRTVLLRMTGLGGAEPLLDHLIGGDARTRKAFHGLLRDFEERPEELSDAVRGLLDPARRSQASAELVRLLEAAERGEDAPEPDEADEAGVDATAPHVAAGAAPGLETDAGPAAPPPPPSAAPTPPSPPSQGVQPAPAPRPVPPVPAASADRPTPHPETGAPSRPVPTPKPAPETAERPARSVPEEQPAASTEPPPRARPSEGDEPSAPERGSGSTEPPPAAESPARTPEGASAGARHPAAAGALAGAGAGAAVAAASGRATRPEAVTRPASRAERAPASSLGSGPDSSPELGPESSPEPEPPRDPHAALRRRLDAGDDVSLDDLAARLADDESPGWSRRRTLAVWIEDAEPAALAAALDRVLALIEELPTPSDRMWCLTTLAGRRAWDEPEWQQILAAAESPMLRRRLGHRRVAV